MNIWSNIRGRLKRLEEYRKQIAPPLTIDRDRDGFIKALVGDQKEQYRDDSGGYDAIRALNDTAADDWKN